MRIHLLDQHQEMGLGDYVLLYSEHIDPGDNGGQ
jgi:hypothetical protein